MEVVCADLQVDMEQDATLYYCKALRKECSVPYTGKCEVKRNVVPVEFSGEEVAAMIGLTEVFVAPHAMQLPVVS